MSVDADTFIPEFWPADKILGLILDEQLEGISAGKIVGQIVSAQVASLAAAKIEGKLTQKQIESIAAEQITGKLTNEQIAEIAAAKIVGQLTDAQLGGISAAKIIGEIASGQISSLEALKITGQLTNAQIKELEAAKIKGELTNAQIKSIEAAKVTGQLTNTQLAGLASAKIEGLLTNAQIESLAVAKLVGQISESQIAAKAVTAGKINVAELSAISVNAGLIEAGTFKGVTFETAKGETKMDKEGISILENTSEPVINARAISFLEKAGGTILAAFYAVINSAAESNALVLKLLSPKGTRVSSIILTARDKAEPAAPASVRIQAQGAVGVAERTVVDEEEKSHYRQLSSRRKERDWGLVSELPKTPVVGDVCYYKASTSIIWQLYYDGEGEFPWKKIGGPPLIEEVEAAVETGSTKFVGLTGGPEIKVPLKGDYYIGLGVKSWNSVAVSNHLMSYKIGETEAKGEDSVDCPGDAVGNAPPSTYRKKRKNGLAAATKLLAQYLTSGGTAHFEQRFIEIDPIRVG